MASSRDETFDPTTPARTPGGDPTTPAGDLIKPGDTTPPEKATPPTQAAPKKPRPTRISGTWVAILVAIVVLIFLLVFILQNLADTTIHFLWGQSTLPLGVALLFAAIGGALVVAIVGAARILQLRRQTKR